MNKGWPKRLVLSSCTIRLAERESPMIAASPKNVVGSNSTLAGIRLGVCSWLLGI